MRKTFLKVALIGLLAAAMPSTFTSCKDYDDDITNLTNQTNDLKTQLASVNAAIAALPTKADVSAAQAAAVAQAKSDLNAVKAQLEAAIAGKADKATVDAIQTELNKVKGELETLQALAAKLPEQMEAINTSLTSLESAISKVEEDAVTKGQMIAGLEAQIAELKESTANVGDLTADVAALKAAVNDPANGLAALKAQIAELAEKIQGQGGEAASLAATLRVINGMVTSLRFVDKPNMGGNDLVLTLKNTVKANETIQNGPDNEALNFSLKPNQLTYFADTVLVQVSPAGATLNADDLTLVNSKDETTIAKFVKIAKIEPYNGLLTRADVVAKTGLYQVIFTQADGYVGADDEKQAEENKTATDFDKATMANDGEGNAIRFALALTETNEAGERYLLTPFEITVDGGKVNPSQTIDFTVQPESADAATPLAQIHNRYKYAEDNSSYMYTNVANGDKNMDAVYAVAKGMVNYTASLYEGYSPVGDYKTSNKGPVLDPSDNRTTMDPIVVNFGEDFVINPNFAGPVYSYYVALDLRRATESDGSERGEWRLVEKYITNLNQEVFGNAPITLNITKDANDPKLGGMEEGDVIGFRVWAMNYDGTLVDPDGRAFYVQMGEGEAPAQAVINVPIKIWESNTTEVEPDVTLGSWTTANTEVELSFTMDPIVGDMNNHYFDITTGNGSLFSWQYTYTLPENFDPSKPTFAAANAKVTQPTNKPIIKLGDGNTPGTVRNFNDIFEKITVEVYGYNYNIPDGQTYKGKLTIKTTGKNQRVLQTVDVNISKELPGNVMPKDFGFKSGQTFDGSTLVNYVTAYKDGSNPTTVLSNTMNWGVKADGTAVSVSDYTIYAQVQNGTPGFSIPDTEINDAATPDLYLLTANWWNNSTVTFSTNQTSDLYTINNKGAYVGAPDGSRVSTSNFINSGKAVKFTFIYSYGWFSCPNVGTAAAPVYYGTKDVTASTTKNIEFRTVTYVYKYSWLSGAKSLKLDRNQPTYFSNEGILVSSPIAGLYTLQLDWALNSTDYPLTVVSGTPELSESLQTWWKLEEATFTVDPQTPVNGMYGVRTETVEETDAQGNTVKNTYYKAGTYTGYKISFIGGPQVFPTGQSGTINYKFTNGVYVMAPDENGNIVRQLQETSCSLNVAQ